MQLNVLVFIGVILMCHVFMSGGDEGRRQRNSSAQLLTYLLNSVFEQFNVSTWLCFLIANKLNDETRRETTKTPCTSIYTAILVIFTCATYHFQ
jgi:hypothetical protein